MESISNYECIGFYKDPNVASFEEIDTYFKGLDATTEDEYLEKYPLLMDEMRHLYRVSKALKDFETPKVLESLKQLNKIKQLKQIRGSNLTNV